MQSTVQVKAPAGRHRRKLLMAEFNVQVFSDGTVDWGDLRRYVDPPTMDVRKLVLLLAADVRRP